MSLGDSRYARDASGESGSGVVDLDGGTDESGDDSALGGRLLMERSGSYITPSA
jgi:hypothetical protein